MEVWEEDLDEDKGFPVQVRPHSIQLADEELCWSDGTGLVRPRSQARAPAVQCLQTSLLLHWGAGGSLFRTGARVSYCPSSSACSATCPGSLLCPQGVCACRPMPHSCSLFRVILSLAAGTHRLVSRVEAPSCPTVLPLALPFMCVQGLSLGSCVL